MNSTVQAVLIVLGVYAIALALVAIAWTVGTRRIKRQYEGLRQEINADVFGTFDIPDWSPKTMPTEKDLEE